MKVDIHTPLRTSVFAVLAYYADYRCETRGRTILSRLVGVTRSVVPQLRPLGLNTSHSARMSSLLREIFANTWSETVVLVLADTIYNVTPLFVAESPIDNSSFLFPAAVATSRQALACVQSLSALASASAALFDMAVAQIWRVQAHVAAGATPQRFISLRFTYSSTTSDTALEPECYQIRLR